MFKYGATGKTDDAVFCRGIGGATCKWIATKTVDRSVVNDYAADRFFHRSDLRIHAEKYRCQVSPSIVSRHAASVILATGADAPPLPPLLNA